MQAVTKSQRLLPLLQSPVKLLLQRQPLLYALAVHLLAIIALVWLRPLQPVQVQGATSSLKILSVETDPATKKTPTVAQGTSPSQPSALTGQARKAALRLNSPSTNPTANADPTVEEQAVASTERVATPPTNIPAAAGEGAASTASTRAGSEHRVAPTAPSSTPTVTPPGFDADYLANPAPAYPPLSRRLSEQGTVLLRVNVSDKGEVITLGIERSSHHRRLDQAAMEAVARWRFIPARRGQQTIAAQVIVPVVFNLTL